MDEQDPNQDTELDPRAVPIALVSLAVIILGIVLTYANTTFGALIVLLGLVGIVWVGKLALNQGSRD
jgi:hypothetical protein